MVEVEEESRERGQDEKTRWACDLRLDEALTV